MATIDVGSAATNRGGTWVFSIKRTIIDLTNPANDTGVITSFEIFAVTVNLTLVKCGTFSGSGTSYTNRDGESIGTVTYGSKQTFSGLNCDVTSGDFVGLYAEYGSIERDTSGGSGLLYVAGDQFGTGAQTYTLISDDCFSAYGTGETVEVGHPTTKRWGGVPFMRLNKGIWCF